MTREWTREPDGARDLYLEHFGLGELPFSLTPDTSYFLTAPSHREALNLSLFAIRSGEGFAKIVGEVGTGKTLLCRKLLNLLDDRFVSACIANPLLTPAALPAAVAQELGIEVPQGIDYHGLLARITARLVEIDASGRQSVLFLDEAQALPDASLEALRLLTNLETERKKLLQVVMFAQPELDARLARPEFRQLRQRIGFSYRLRPLDPDELAIYVEHRLRTAGHAGMPLFTGRALDALFRASRGIPRLVNILAHKSLLAAYGEMERRVRRSHVRRAAFDTEGVRRPGALRLPARWFARGRALAAALVAAASAIRGAA